MGAPGGAAASGLPAGPARFRCPEDFCARRLAPGAAFCLGAPGKRLLLIRAPADFRPESLSGHRLALRGSPLLRASQPDGSQKVYGLRATREESVARLLIAAGRPERLICAQPFGGSLRIQERDGAPDAPRPLFPVPERPAPKVPAGLKQRFFPFGARLPSSGAPPRKAARERGKKRPLLPWKQALWRSEGPEQLLGGSPEPAEPLLGRAGSKQRPLKEEAEEPAAATGPATLPGLGGRLLWQDAQPSGHLEEASWSGEAEEPGRRARKKAKKRKTETEELPNPSSRYWQPEWELRLQGGREREMPEAGAEGLWGAAATKEEP
ncbi:DNA-directed RNA polymerase I subunit RPA34, partial [Notechis scutatus]|uniref:DNA-directed RNA polymerase I subunit RPA34 n=1 Tax=Notechis scutatus TaxID=8663 RepID=A0A6J1VTM0_9SAUR